MEDEAPHRAIRGGNIDIDASCLRSLRRQIPRRRLGQKMAGFPERLGGGAVIKGGGGNGPKNIRGRFRLGENPTGDLKRVGNEKGSAPPCIAADGEG